MSPSCLVTKKAPFTGANTIRQGRFEQADGGTLFLDEIGDMRSTSSDRLLRVLADGQFYRVAAMRRLRSMYYHCRHPTRTLSCASRRGNSVKTYSTA
ncbi:Nitrogen regulation protein NR(I) [Leclercia adecarboxylata]|uniref:Nitrogen regulation protein NR(I) n=1 Tax=Leclercia adecarboxylata TaxID=83655 RepID=A0A4U9J2H4_9ENTR|nr:Nitrogen regulation protein NR(I) [Leclercia adecarboxylata]